MADGDKKSAKDPRERKKITNPHDSFFREMMSEPKVYREFLRKYLPTGVRQHLDIRTAKPSKDHFVDERLRHLYSDCLYTVRDKAGQSIGIYVLVEHQSTPDFWGPYRIWRYVFAAWDDIQRETQAQKTLLPLIIPVLVYNGAKPYRQSLDLRELIAGPRDLVDQVLFGPVHLVALNTIEDQILKEETHLGVLFLTLKHAFDEAMPYDQILVQLGRVKSEKLLRRFLLAVIRYIFNTREDADEHLLQNLVTNKLSKVLGVEVMTLAEKLEQKGRQKGRREGRQEAVRSVAFRLLKSGLDESVIAKSTGLSLKELRELKLASDIL